MKSRLIRVRDISMSDEDNWRRLAERAVEPNPFAEPDFLLLSSQHFKDYAEAMIVVAEEGGEFRTVLPIIKTIKRRNPPRNVAETRGYPASVGLSPRPREPHP